MISFKLHSHIYFTYYKCYYQIIFYYSVYIDELIITIKYIMLCLYVCDYVFVCVCLHVFMCVCLCVCVCKGT